MKARQHVRNEGSRRFKSTPLRRAGGHQGRTIIGSPVSLFARHSGQHRAATRIVSDAFALSTDAGTLSGGSDPRFNYGSVRSRHRLSVDQEQEWRATRRAYDRRCFTRCRPSAGTADDRIEAAAEIVPQIEADKIVSVKRPSLHEVISSDRGGA